jgi:hypothetical protein
MTQSAATANVSLGLKWLVAILLLFGLLYPSTMKLEHFGGIAVTDPSLRQTGSSLYLENPGLFCTLQQTFDAALADHKDTLLYRTCVGIKDPNRNFELIMRDYIKTLGYLVSKQTMRTNKFDDVTVRIREILESVRLSNGSNHLLKGPIYVLMFQAPYYRDLRTGSSGMNTVISVQPFNASDYRYNPSMILRDVVENEPLGSMEPTEGVSFVFYIMFPMYDPANKLRMMSPDASNDAVSQCVGYWLKQATNENMCRMKCPNHSGYTCGCLNTMRPYPSVCLGPKNKKDLQKKEFINYGIFYRVHERHALNVQMFDETAFFKDDCSTKR